MITSGPFGVPHVIVRIEGAAGRITLNRPRALNALSLSMVRSVRAALRMFEHNANVRLVIIDGAGSRGFCAGGDIRAIAESIQNGDGLADKFWREEYELNAAIACFPKPFVAIMDGIVMGGGVGLACHGSHRVVTERTEIAMPEVRIGFSPDVGGTWLMARAPRELGTYMALTGSNVSAATSVHAGFADYVVKAEDVPKLVGELSDFNFSRNAAGEVDLILMAFASETQPAPPQNCIDHLELAFQGQSVGKILERLKASGKPALVSAAATIEGNCPFSVEVALRALRRARKLPSLEDCLAMEYRVGARLSKRQDFREGVRAAIVDKDRTPMWSPKAFCDVSASDVEGLFAPLTEAELWALA